MVVRKTWAVSQPGGLQTTVDGRHSLGALLWPGSGALVKRAGRFPQNLAAFVVTASAPTPDGFVHVSPGQLAVMGTRSIAPYLGAVDAVVDVNVLAVPAHASLTRYDLIVAQQSDPLHTDGNGDLWIGPIRGTASATPSDPAVTTANGAPTNSPDYVVLARVVVPPTASSAGILQANITQLFTAHTVASGGLLPVENQTERDALTGTRYDGMAVWRRDRDWEEVFDGAGWRISGTAVCTSTTDRDAVITSPYNGQLAVTTDTGTIWLRHSGAWVSMGRASGEITYTPTVTATGGALVLGTGGSIGGRYVERGKMIDLHIYMNVGTGNDTKSGTLNFGLPPGMTVAAGGVERTGVAKLYNGPTGRIFHGIVYAPAGSATIQVFMPESPSLTSLAGLRSASAPGSPGTGVPQLAGVYTLGDNSNVDIDVALAIN
ncbi:hypothetical protein [Saccharothrix lopnurensis]|uniref:Minor tail protein n=1 Tax=Saccharothrix lopnurensis TaxID=1670621 RepID=A0ABW1PHB3_9PSEU